MASFKYHDLFQISASERLKRVQITAVTMKDLTVPIMSYHKGEMNSLVRLYQNWVWGRFWEGLWGP